MQAKVSLNEDAFNAYFDMLETQLDEVARGVVITYWNLVLKNSPQYTGAMAASWNFTYGAPVFVDRSNDTPFDPLHEEPHKKGDPEAIQIANNASREALNSFKLGEVAYMTNGDPMSEQIEEGTLSPPLRSVNRPSHAMMNSLGVIDARYSRGITLRTGKDLMKVKIA